jgi:adenylate cyclase
MADIFVSYARVDRARVAPLVAALEAQGWSIWWDPEIAPGQEFDRQIAQELDAAKAVIVVWTPASVDSRWVRGEAREAADRGVLVPVRFDKARLPIDARAMHTTDLDGWNGATDGQAYIDLCRALRPLVERRLAREGRRDTERGSADGAPAAADARAQPAHGVSICVLPFANMSGDPEQEYFADGISEDIITDLSKVAALSVTSRNSAFAFKGKHVDLRQVARQLEVTHVLEGSVRKAGSRVRITAQLIDAARDSHVWAERYDRNLSDIFALQDEISQAIVEALKLTLFPEEKRAIEQRGTANVEAYDKYLRARALLHHQGAAELLRAMQIFREALALDPNFAPAWRGLYLAHRDAILYAAESTEEALGGMDAAARHISALAPDAWWGHALRADQLTAQHRWCEAEAAAEAALVSAPASEVDAVWTYLNFLIGVGRMEEAVPCAERTRRADPLSLLASVVVCGALEFSGRLAEADAEYERSKDLSGARDVVEDFALFRALARGGAAVDEDAVKRCMAHWTVPVAGLEDLPEIFARPEVMLERLRKAQTDPINQDVTRQFKIALWAAWHGDAALAATALRRFAIDLHNPRPGAIWHPALREARKTPVFKEIVRDLGLADYWRRSGQWGDFARPLGDGDFEVVR